MDLTRFFKYSLFPGKTVDISLFVRVLSLYPMSPLITSSLLFKYFFSQSPFQSVGCLVLHLPLFHLLSLSIHPSVQRSDFISFQADTSLRLVSIHPSVERPDVISSEHDTSLCLVFTYPSLHTSFSLRRSMYIIL